MAMRGRLIAFEGVEGAGKSTQIALLTEALRARGRVVRQTREPGGTALGAEIRQLVLGIRDPAPQPMAELLLYLADRAQHLGELILPALARGEVVLTDRFSASTIAYQGYARQLEMARVVDLDALVRHGVQPDLTILLDCDVSVGLRRARGDDRFHRERVEFHQRVRDGFLDLARRDPASWRVIDAGEDAAAIHALVLAATLDCIDQQGDRDA